jgi:short-subunit dehydrogenase
MRRSVAHRPGPFSSIVWPIPSLRAWYTRCMSREPDAAFVARYGTWALVAGASEGLGAAFARQLAGRGLNVVLVARRAELLAQLADELRAGGRDVRTVALDLGARDLSERLAEATRGLEIGLVVYNAAYSLIGEFASQSLDDKLRVLDVNCRGPLIVAHALGGPMAERGRGGIILMSSLAGTQGSPHISTYAASKAFNLVLGEGLWDELGARGVDVLTCRAGATRTPNYVASKPRSAGAPVMEPEAVAAAAIAALGKKPSMIPGWGNRAAAAFMGVLPRKAAIRLMGNATRKMYR